MLRISKLTDAEYVLEQVAGGLEDYYLGRGEAPGGWAGAEAARFGLRDARERLLARTARTDAPSGANADADADGAASERAKDDLAQLDAAIAVAAGRPPPRRLTATIPGPRRRPRSTTP